MQKALLTDKELVTQYLQGKESALGVLINRHRDKIFTSIYIKVKDTALAEDIFQDTFIKVVDTLRQKKYKEEGKFLPWVMRIAYNLTIDHFRKVKRIPNITTEEGFDIFEVLDFKEDSQEDIISKDETHKAVKKMIEMLPEDQKEVVILRHYFDFSFKEISQLTDVSINTALGRMRYALINLRKMMDKKEIAFQ